MNLPKFFRTRFFTLKRFGRFLFVCACLVTLCALVIVEENWRAKHDWQAYRQEQEARGVILNIKPIIPPEVPDDQNFATTPLLASLFEKPNSPEALKLSEKLEPPHPRNAKAPPLGNRLTGERFDPEKWKTSLGGVDVLTWMQKLDPELQEITAASQRPYSRFPLAYDKGFTASLPHLNILMKLAKLYALRACAELHAGQSDAALADLQTALRLGDSIKHEPFLISCLVRIAIYQNTLQALWPGLEDHCWTDAQLTELQSALAKIDLLENFKLALQGERAGCNDALLGIVEKPETLPVLLTLNGASPDNKIGWLIPRAIIYRNLLAINGLYGKYYTASVDPVAHRIDPSAFSSSDADMTQKMQHIPNPYTALTRVLMPALTSSSARTGYMQCSMDEAVISCALERYRLATGEYPAALEELTPKFMDKLPHDIITGTPLHYRRNDGGTYLLYSDGWNGKDDGGKPGLTPSNDPAPLKDDWVWVVRPAQAPAPKPAG